MSAGLLTHAAETFVELCGLRDDLGPLLAGWDVCIELIGNDERVAFVIEGEHVRIAAPGAPLSVRRVEVFGDAGLLTAILEDAADPAMAYMDGLVELEGYPEDLMRLDIVVSELW